MRPYFFSNSKFKDGDDVGFYHELMYKKMVLEFPTNFTHFLDFSDTPTSEFKSTRMLKRNKGQIGMVYIAIRHTTLHTMLVGYRIRPSRQ